MSRYLVTVIAWGGASLPPAVALTLPTQRFIESCDDGSEAIDRMERDYGRGALIMEAVAQPVGRPSEVSIDEMIASLKPSRPMLVRESSPVYVTGGADHYPDAQYYNAKRLCPVCRDSACETKTNECGREGRAVREAPVRYTLTVELENDAFADELGTELGRILRHYSRRIRLGQHSTGATESVIDANGNRVGSSKLHLYERSPKYRAGVRTLHLTDDDYATLCGEAVEYVESTEDVAGILANEPRHTCAKCINVALRNLKGVAA